VKFDSSGAAARQVDRDVIDRDSYEPAYSQLSNIIRRQIASGVYRPGDRLPSEGQLCAQYGVSPMTVRRVINMLAEGGLVNAMQGKGTFVRPMDLGEATFRLKDLKDQLSGGEDRSVRLLEARVVTAGEKAARKLAIAEGGRVVFIRRLLLQADTPIMYHREYLLYDPRRPLVEAELDVTTVEGLLRGHGSEGLRSGELTIEAVTLREEEAGLLDTAVASAAFRIEHVFYDLEARPVSWGWFICRADRFKLRTWIGAGAG
jgi:DNA-binding GntR family transcriptional regulator